jgi:hypothetical protein
MPLTTTGRTKLEHAENYLAIQMSLQGVAYCSNSPAIWYWYRYGFYAIRQFLAHNDAQASSTQEN